MLLDEDSQIRSSFGPLGRSKVIRSQFGGSLIVTKDGQQLLECYLSGPSHDDHLRKVLIRMCCSVTKQHGDGSMSALIIMSLLVRSLSSMKSIAHRILLLNALEAMIHAIEVNKEIIIDYFIAKSVWSAIADSDKVSTVLSDRICGLWGSILYPATNSSIAANIGVLLDRWLGLRETSLKSIGESCQTILGNWDSYVIVSLSGLSLENSYRVPRSQVILEGRCRDFTSLRSRKSVAYDSERTACKKGFRFVCLKHFMPPTAAESITQSVTVTLNSLSDLHTAETSSPNLFAKTESYEVRKFIKWLKSNEISAVFCSDSIDDDVIHLAASAGIINVDRVPIAYLEHLSHTAAIKLWDTTSDIITSTIASRGVQGLWGHFLCVDRVTFGSQSDTYFRIEGVEGIEGMEVGVKSNTIADEKNGENGARSSAEKGSHSDSADIRIGAECGTRSTDTNRNNMASQLVLQCTSALSSSLYCRLLRRCLVATARINDYSASTRAAVSSSGASARSSASPPSSFSSRPYSAPSSSSSLPSVTPTSEGDSAHTPSPPPSTVSSSIPSCSSSCTSSAPPSAPPSSAPSSTAPTTSVPSSSAPSSFPPRWTGWVPGGGAAEMGWSALWGMVAQRLTLRLPSDLSGTIPEDRSNLSGTIPEGRSDLCGSIPEDHSIGNNAEHSVREGDENEKKSGASDEKKGRSRGPLSFPSVLSELVDVVTSTIMTNISEKHQINSSLNPDEYFQRHSSYVKAVHHVIEFCTLLSHAYAEVPRLLLINASRGAGGAVRIPKRTENMWCAWRDHYSKSNIRDDNCKNNRNTLGSDTVRSVDRDYGGSFEGSFPLSGAGRLGLVCLLRRTERRTGRNSAGSYTSSSPESPLFDIVPSNTPYEPLCFLCDAMSEDPGPDSGADLGPDSGFYPVVGTLSQFWAVFSTVLEGSRLFLRTGGSEGIVLVKRVQSKGKNRTLVKSRKRTDSISSGSDESDDSGEEEAEYG